ncbi:carbonic anhydrase 2-like [Eurosta solidaginis]|uniref:carbonic anhydrase 2-like n=1 Tax=Eurosta solidaginis TaxID=178769 RepID=UPI0035312360
MIDDRQQDVNIVPNKNVDEIQEPFSYENPKNWVKQYPQCGGKNQSPIAINTNKTIPIDIPAIIFGEYDTHLSEDLTLENNGHTITFRIPPTVKNSLPYITNGPLKGKYEAINVHFHWGAPLEKGSEHQINNKRFDLEMHILHKNTKYSSVEEALEYDDGLAVIAVLFKVHKLKNRASSLGLQTIFDIVPYVFGFNTTATTSKFITLGSLLPNISRENYYTYQGSLTTPPCSEAVSWLVYPEAIPIPLYYMRNFWGVLDEDGQLLYNNFRTLQPIHLRKVYVRKQTKKCCNA